MPETRDFDAVLDYRNQFTVGTPEWEALTGLINLLIDMDTFTHAMHSHLRHEAASGTGLSGADHSPADDKAADTMPEQTPEIAIAQIVAEHMACPMFESLTGQTPERASRSAAEAILRWMADQ